MTPAPAPWIGSLGAIAFDGGVRFRVWSPDATGIDVVFEGGHDAVSMQPDGDDGCWSVDVPGIIRGARYRLRKDGGQPVPDPCSRSQPDGVHAASEVDDPRVFAWSDGGFHSMPPSEMVIYECHIGTFTVAGTFDSAIPELPRLRELGITALELMPVAAFPGRRNWGYDGAATYAPSAVYGGPDGLRRLVNAAHSEGIAVILDVVYNHFGPDGNYTGFFSPYYMTNRHQTLWGSAVNFDQPGSEGVRRFVIENALHWMHEYHIDGLRLDATNTIRDESNRHILAELHDNLSRFKRTAAEPYLVAETTENDLRYFAPTVSGGFGFAAVWADEFHHVVRNMLHKEREGYLRRFAGTGSELAATVTNGFLRERGGFRAIRDSVPWPAYVYCIQNHDQIGNRAFGERISETAPLEAVLAATVPLLLLPQTPLMFQGQEFAARSPFLYFTDHNAELGRRITAGRRAEFAEFSAFSNEGTREQIPDPQAESTFLRSKLCEDEMRSPRGLAVIALHRELLRMRRGDAVLRASRDARVPLDAESSANTLSVRVATASGERQIVANLSGEPAALPLGRGWRCVLHSREARFGGDGKAPQISGGNVTLPAWSGAFLAPA